MLMQPVCAGGAAGLLSYAQERAQFSGQYGVSKTGREMVAERQNKGQSRTVCGSGGDLGKYSHIGP